MSRPIANVLVLIITLGVPIILILSNVLLFMNPGWLAYEYSKPDFPKAQLFNDKDRLYFGSESIEYIRGNRTLDQFKALGVYQDREIAHMIDVRVLVDKVKVVLPVTAVLVVIALGVLAKDLPGFRKPGRSDLAPRGLLNGAILTIVLFVAIGIFAATGFDTFFVLFHRIFFTGDSWLFLYTDSLIQFYPETFWFETSLVLVSLTVVEAIVVGAIGWAWKRRMSQ